VFDIHKLAWVDMLVGPLCLLGPPALGPRVKTALTNYSLPLI